MRTARVGYAGRIHDAVWHPDGVELTDGRVVGEADVVWLPPFAVGTVIALGLNYAAHRRELQSELAVAQEEPLVFLKGPNTVLGHRGFTRRPAGAKMMHFECELAVVIGRGGRFIPVRDALEHVAGYTVCNDYAVRDALENWYRPNARAKNRDGATVLGPYLVSADEVSDPQALDLRTRVNGRIVQEGSTADMVTGVAELIAYLSAFMTLAPGDVILTGTPEGVSNVVAGDEVVCEIDGVGSLLNTLMDDRDSEFAVKG